MVKRLEYPIAKTDGNLALRKDGVVTAFYRVPNTPITITDTDKKRKHKVTVEQVIKKLEKYHFFEVDLVPKDFLLKEKAKDFERDLAPDSQKVGKKSLERTVNALTKEMEIPYEYEWLITITIEKNLVRENLKDVVKNQLGDIAENMANLLGFEVETLSNWYENYQEVEATIYQLLSPLKAKRLTNEELFYHQALQFMMYIPHLKEEVLANRELANVTDAVISMPEKGILEFSSIYGTSYISILPIGQFQQRLGKN